MELRRKFNLLVTCAVVSIVMTFISCSDFLEEKPYSFVKPEQVGDSDEAVEQWVTGTYSKMLDDLARWGYFPRVLEMDCDYVSGPDWAFANMGAGNFQSEEMINFFWKGFYNMIFRSSYAEYYISQMKNPDENIKNNAIGEMRFIRAFSYFMLTRAYGEIPIISLEQSVGVMNDGVELNQPRSAIKDVYTEIIKLLEGNETEKGAIELMFDNNNSEFVEGHASKGAAAALLAKVYATMASASMPVGTEINIRTGQAYQYSNGIKVATTLVNKKLNKKAVTGYVFSWQDCYTKAAYYAEKIIKQEYGSYDLLPYDDLWKKSFNNKIEHMFMLADVSGDEKYGTTIHLYFSGQQDGAGCIRTGLWIGNRWHWYQLFDSDDYRITKGVKHRYQYSDGVVYNTACYYPGTEEYKKMAEGYTENDEYYPPVAPYNDGKTYKYSFGDSRFLSFTTKDDDVCDPQIERTDGYWPFIRYADVLLIYAEAKCELGEGVSSEAILKLNDVRLRSNAELAETTGNGAITSKEQLRSAILEERAKEFAMEGDRRWDLIRWGIYLDAMNAIGGVNNDGSETKYDENNIYKYREEKHLLWPLPVSEIDGNSAITENNPGWS